jgi:uncharacterized protein YceK
MKTSLLALALTVLLAGCGTIADIATDQKIYGGIQKDVALIEDPVLPKTSPPEYFFPLVIFGILDVPLSFVLDTVLLPVTITISARSDDQGR